MDKLSVQFRRVSITGGIATFALLPLLLALAPMHLWPSKPPEARGGSAHIAQLAAVPDQRPLAAVPPTPGSSQSPLLLPQRPGAVAERWHLTFADEFDGDGLDQSRWNTSFWWGRSRDEELQYYTDDSVQVNDGVLQLQADRRTVARHDYTSGVVTTQGKFAQAYGFFEVRAKATAGKGLWPAVWLLTEAGSRTVWPPEVDIVEFRGAERSMAFMNYHYDAPMISHGQASKGYDGPDFTLDFHTFGLDWTPGALTWYIDGTERHRVLMNIPKMDMYVIANLAVGDWGGQPDRSTPFPSSFLVDYVRVWQRLGSPVPH